MTIKHKTSVLKRGKLELLKPSDSASKPLVIIPARGGSKCIPRKNIRSLGGMPLIAYSIKVALTAKKVGHVVLSTDDEEIAEIGRQLGAEVPFLRSPESSTDNATVGGAIIEVLTHYGNKSGLVPNYLVTYPTSPFKTPQLLDLMASKLKSGYSKVYTVFPVDLPKHVFRENAKGMFVKTDLMSLCVQSFRCSGNLSGASNVTNSSDTYYHPINNPIERIDIDTHADLEYAKFVVDNGLYTFNVPELDRLNCKQ